MQEMVVADSVIDASFNTAIVAKGWFQTRTHPLEIGYVIKRWKKTGALWVGYYNGDPKTANCDEWYPLDVPEDD
jgi:hypothetical protein